MKPPKIALRTMSAMSSKTTWRGLVLALLYLLPPIVYFCLGAWWLIENGLILYGVMGWIISTILFSWLSRRWLEEGVNILPPLDWEKPWTFAPRDAEAWKIIQDTAERASDLSLDQLTRMEVYQETSEELARRVSACYYPNVENPLDKLPILDLIVAIELAAEDLEGLCRQVPAMDQLTPGHLKGLSKAMGFAQTAHELYNFALPVFRPVTGLPRLIVQKLVAEPAWKQTKEGIQRWLFRAYVNRLGVHLVELSSGRLRGGSAAYRRSKMVHADGVNPAQEDVSDFTRPNSDVKSRPELTVTALIPGLDSKARRERFGLWQHLSESGHEQLAEALNQTHRGLDGLAYVEDLKWTLADWPDQANDFLSTESDERWAQSIVNFMKADCVLVDLRDIPAMHQLGHAQEILDRMGRGYEHQMDWPVAPILILTDSIDPSELQISEHLTREVRFHHKVVLENLKDVPYSDLNGFDPEVETLADLVHVLPLARQRALARGMAEDARHSGFRRAASQVADAAGRAGLEMVRGWFTRGAAPKAESAQDASEKSDSPSDR